jgi:hypothetical protein
MIAPAGACAASCAACGANGSNAIVPATQPTQVALSASVERSAIICSRTAPA